MEKRNPTEQELELFVRQNVHYCVSSLVYTLAQGNVEGSAAFGMGSTDSREACEQAAELCYGVEDWEEAAIQAGWAYSVGKGDVWAFTHPDHGTDWASEEWRELCETHDIEPYQREIYEHWIVSDYLADILERLGERVDKDFAGLVVWGRTTTGQSISMDYVIGQAWLTRFDREGE